MVTESNNKKKSIWWTKNSFLMVYSLDHYHCSPGISIGAQILPPPSPPQVIHQRPSGDSARRSVLVYNKGPLTRLMCLSFLFVPFCTLSSLSLSSYADSLLSKSSSLPISLRHTFFFPLQHAVLQAIQGKILGLPPSIYSVSKRR